MARRTIFDDKICVECRIRKPLSEFYPKGFYEDGRQKYVAYCISCAPRRRAKYEERKAKREECLGYYRMDALTVKARKMAAQKGHELMPKFQRNKSQTEAIGICQLCGLTISIHSPSFGIAGEVLENRCARTGIAERALGKILLPAYANFEPLFSKAET